MTISPGDPGPTDPTAGGTPVPPYEGRRGSADVEPEEQAHREGADVGGATGPVDADGDADGTTEDAATRDEDEEGDGE